MANATEIAAAIYRKYNDHYDCEIQGCCPLIADEIQRATGGECVAGEITFYGGTQRRTHWWVDLQGVTLDPMGDAMMSDPRDFGERVEIHRDRGTFEAILPEYEQWRVIGLDDATSGHVPADHAMNLTGSFCRPIPADQRRNPPGCPDADWCRGNRACWWQCVGGDE